MAFEAFPAEAVQQFSDPGSYFVRENGKLRSPPGMGPHTRSHLEPSQEVINVKPTLTETSSTNHSGNTPRKLFDMTLDFVAANILLVDSLVGFPEVVGRQLFDAAYRHGNLSINALQLFSDAYGSAILQSINLSGHHLVVNQHTDCLTAFPCLTELEVRGCRLGDDHEIIPSIANCHSLTRLGLAFNCLSDVGIQRLTAPMRVMRRGPRNLSIIDLAGNKKISDKSARRYLAACTSLQAIDLSGCNISSAGLDVLKSKLRLRAKTTSTAPFQSSVKTVGWALPLVEQWIASSTNLMERGKCKANRHQAHRTSNALHFYGKAGKRLENVSTSSLPKPKPLISPVIQLVAATNYVHVQPNSDPADKKVKRLKVKMRADRLTRECTNPVTCPQELESSQCKEGRDMARTNVDEQIMYQYAVTSQDTFGEKTPTGALQHWRSSDLMSKYPAHPRDEAILKQEPIRTTRPPPKKKIKLSTEASKASSEKEPPARLQASDWRTTCDRVHMKSKGQGSHTNRRQTAGCRQPVSQQGNGLWTAMNSEEWA